jgi:glycosyltransferase involved in cell wall biosynthesis
MRIALLFRSFGPYHIARLRAAREKASILALEFIDSDHEYRWAIPDEKRASEIISLSTSEPNNFVGRFGNSMPGRVNARRKMKLETELHKFAPDAVAIPGYSESFSLLTARLCKKLGIPAILMSDSHDLGQRRHPLKEAMKRRIIRLFDAAFVAGAPHADYLVRLGFPHRKITTGYDVIDNLHFAPNAEATDRPTTFNLPDRFFFCCSRFVEGKNLQFLIDAFHRYKRQAGPLAWDLVITGDGPLYTPLLRHVQRLSLCHNVHMIGHKSYDELPHLYATAGAFVFPSLSETWGLVVNEAMAAGLPLLISNVIGCQHDLVRNGVNGYLFDPNDMTQLAALMARVAENSERGTMGEASRIIIRHWDLDRFAAGLFDAASIAAKSRGEPRARGATGLALTLAYWAQMPAS